ncbi:MAG: helix-hairpin-helix domain-containing protein [Bacteroidales bacterium]|nr:helix-hairpin-helix domain-containing protein [Bacteroidales bacterium]
MKYQLLWILVLWLLPLNTLAQQDDNEILSDILTNAAESDDENMAETADMDCEYLEDIAENKIDLNNCDTAQLQSLPILNAIQIRDLLEYIGRYGELKSMGELKGVPSFSTGTIRQMKHFATIHHTTDTMSYSLRKMAAKGHHYISSFNKAVLERQAAYVADSTGHTKYQGNRMRWCIKYRYKFKDRIAWGITAEKTPAKASTSTNTNTASITILCLSE